MQVVSENSEADLAGNRAMADVDWSLRQLTANLLRVLRGAGKAYELPHQAQEFISSLVSFRDVVGHLPPDYDLAACLTLDPDPELLSRFSSENRQEMHLEKQIVRGALQIAASHLLGQTTQRRAGESQMTDGIRATEAFRIERNKAWEAKMRRDPIGPMKRRRKPKPAS